MAASTCAYGFERANLGHAFFGERRNLLNRPVRIVMYFGHENIERRSLMHVRQFPIECVVEAEDVGLAFLCNPYTRRKSRKTFGLFFDDIPLIRQEPVRAVAHGVTDTFRTAGARPSQIVFAIDVSKGSGPSSGKNSDLFSNIDNAA